MGCGSNIINDILNSCNTLQVAGSETIAYLFDRSSFSLTYDLTDKNKITGIIGSGYCYPITSIRKELNVGSDLIQSDNLPDRFRHFLSFQPYDRSSVNLMQLDTIEDFFAVVFLKGEKTEGSIIVVGAGQGLVKIGYNNRSNDNSGISTYEFSSKEGEYEKYSRYTFWDTDYSTSMALIIGLTPGAGPSAPSILSDVTTLEWLEYKDNITEDVGVSEWGDKSINGNSPVQAVGADQPTLDSDGITTDGISQYLAVLYAQAQPVTIYTVLRINEWVGANYIMAGNGPTTRAGILYMWSLIPKMNLLYTFGGYDYGAVDQFILVKAVYNGTSSTLQVNYMPEKTGDGGTGPYNGPVLGADYNKTHFGNVTFQARVVRQGAEAEGSANDIAIKNYLISKFGIDARKISVLGDSISVYTRWPAFLVNENHAVSGDSILADMANQVLTAATDDADIIILALGTNDNNAGDMSALQAIVEQAIIDLKASNTSATLYYMNILPVWTDVTGTTEVDKGNLRTMIEAACTAQSITCWDTYTVPWITASDTSDGLHPTLAGSKKIADRIKNLI